MELTVPLHYEGQLTLRIDDGSPDELMMPVHPLEPIRSLSLRLEKAVYHANEAGNPLTSPAMMDSMVHPIVNFFIFICFPNIISFHLARLSGSPRTSDDDGRFQRDPSGCSRSKQRHCSVLERSTFDDPTADE